MTDSRSESERKVDSLFDKILEEAEGLPVKIVDIPGQKHARTGICLLAEELTPALIDSVVYALSTYETNKPAQPAIREDRANPEEPPSCQVSVEERSDLFDLFTDDES